MILNGAGNRPALISPHNLLLPMPPMALRVCASFQNNAPGVGSAFASSSAIAFASVEDFVEGLGMAGEA